MILQSEKLQTHLQQLTDLDDRHCEFLEIMLHPEMNYPPTPKQCSEITSRLNFMPAGLENLFTKVSSLRLLELYVLGGRKNLNFGILEDGMKEAATLMAQLETKEDLGAEEFDIGDE